MSETSLHRIPARTGITIPLAKNHTIKIINTYGKQVIDFWAFDLTDTNEYLSMSHTHAGLLKLNPVVGDTLYSSTSQPILILTEDTTKGAHDTLIAACDSGRYKALGVEGYHASCTDNYREAVRTLTKLEFPVVPPSPLNLFMNVPINPGGTLSFEIPSSGKGQHVCLRAQMDLIIIMSACPMDLRATNNWNPTEAHYSVFSTSGEFSRQLA